MKLLDEMLFDFDDIVTFMETNTHEDIVKYVAITRFVKMGSLPHVLVKEKSFDNVKILNDNVEVNYIEFLQTQFIGAGKNKTGKFATAYDYIKSLEYDLPKYEKAYRLLDDDLSRKTMFYILMYRFNGDLRMLEAVRTGAIQYYQPELIPEKENGVLLDCGGYDGNTVIDYIETYGENYKKIYCFEPDPTQFEVCKENTKKYANIVCINKGVSDESGTMKFISDVTAAGGNKISEAGNISVDIAIIDEEIKEPVTFIKMDIEGVETAALHGCKQHIKNDRPHLTICLYHILSDIFTIPLLINNFDKNYKHNIRFHGYKEEGADFWQPWEIVLYSTPKDGI